MHKAPGKSTKGPHNWEFNFKTFYTALTTRFLGIDGICEQVASVMASYLNRQHVWNESIAPRLLLVGPPSSGKTQLAASMGELLNATVATVNAGLLSPEGYKGLSISDALLSLNPTRMKSKSRSWKKQMIVIDEICKIQRRDDPWLNQLIFSTLPVLGGEDLTSANADAFLSPKPLSTFDTIVVMMGVFPSIEAATWQSHTTATAALTQYGFCDEWISRLTHIIYMPRIERSVLKTIIQREANMIGEFFKSGPLHPALTSAQMASIEEHIYQNPLGIRHAKMHIYDALQKQAIKAIGDRKHL